jgi:hypothetical protein
MNNETNQLQTENTVQNTEKSAPIQPVNPVTPQPKESADISEGLNLMPEMSQEEIVVEKTKSTVNIGSIVSLIGLVLIILVVVGFNIISKQVLNTKKEALGVMENKLNQQVDNIIANEEIVDRAVLYTNVKKGAFSHKKIIEFLNTVGTKAGSVEMRSVMISEELEFTYAGNTSSLEQVSKLWYILGTDENIDSINLESVGKGENNVSFTFKGLLNGKNFYNQ